MAENSGRESAAERPNPSQAVERASRFSESAVVGTLRTPQEAAPLRPRVAFFISYSRQKQSRKLTHDLLDRLKVRFHNSPEYEFELWMDGDIDPGERFHDLIQTAIEHCHFGLLFVGHHFLASRYVSEHELPKFIDLEGQPALATRRAIPIGLTPVPFDGSCNLKGLEKTIVFRDSADKFFSERTSETTKEAFADQLFQKIRRVVQKHLAKLPAAPPREPSDPPSAPEGSLQTAEEKALWLSRNQRRGIELFVDTEGVEANLASGVKESSSPRVDAVSHLLAWVSDPGGPPFYALLGEYGMGKTTTCEAFTERLIAERKENPALRVPVYLDLRKLGEKAKENPLLEEVLAEVLARSWTAGATTADAVTPAEVIELVRTGRAVAIFDGLDEVLVHLTPGEGKKFTRELWRILPPPGKKRRKDGADEEEPAGPTGKLLLSCRTHYFRTVHEERSHFSGEGREPLAGSDYRALLLLPFTPEQIEEYLRKHLPGADVEAVLALIRSVHNLPEMAERPYTLKLIAEHIPELERLKAEGRTVQGVTLYRAMVREWLLRDDPKHQLQPVHKERLMEVLAAELWKSGRRTWQVADLEQWLVDFLDANPRVAAHYRLKDPVILMEDLRTATFLVREGEESFRFAHTSLQEYFLAAHLARALAEGRTDAWEMAVPSLETLDFLGQLLAESRGANESEKEKELATLREIRGGYRPQVSELALAYALRAVKQGWPAPALAGWQLQGAKLRGWEFEGKQGDGAPLLDLQRMSFAGADLRDARFRRVNLDGADFTGADLTTAEVLGGKARQARFGAAKLVGAIFREMDFEGTDWEEVELYRTQWLRCEGVGLAVEAPRGFMAPCASGRVGTARERARLRSLAGHSGWVRFCGFDASAQQVVSVGSDGTVLLWDAATGELLRPLAEHSGWASPCGFDASGQRVVSAGSNGTILLWDVATDKPLRVLAGHASRVRFCGLDAKGQLVVSTGEDGTVLLWSAATGKPLRALEGHRGEVRFCGFDATGQRLVSAGSDGRVLLWDVATGEPLRVFKGHRGGARFCDLDATGQRVVSAGEDGRVRLWDATTGELLKVLKRHRKGVSSCGFDTTGQRVVSAGEDGTVCLWETATGELLQALSGHRGGVLSCGFDAMGQRLVSAGEDGTVRLWDTATGEFLRALAGHRREVLSCGFDATGQRLVSAGSDGTVRLWDAKTGKPLRSLEGHRGGILSCGFDATDQRLVSAGSDGTVRLWDAETGKPVRSLEGHRRGVRFCGFDATGQRVVSAGSDGTVRLWDTVTGKPLRVLVGHRGGVRSCGFDATGQRVVSAGDDGTVRLWEAATGEPLSVLKGHRRGVLACGFDATGQQVVSAGSDGRVRLWDAVTGEPLWTFRGHRGGVRSCGFDATGQQVVSAGSDGTVRLWEAATGEPLRALEGHRGWVWSCGFDATGQRVVSAGSDGTVRLWDAATGVETLRFEMLPHGEHAVFDVLEDRLLEASPDAWRWLAWLIPDPETGELVRWPAETFGPLPTARERKAG